MSHKHEVGRLTNRSRLGSRQFIPTQRDGRLERVPPLSVSAANPLLSALLSTYTPTTSTNHHDGQHLPPAAPVLSQCQSEYRQTTPSLVKRYSKSATIKSNLLVFLLERETIQTRKTVATGVPVYILKERSAFMSPPSLIAGIRLRSGEIEFVVLVLYAFKSDGIELGVLAQD
ncbi:hypothetical protein BD769DRAFT_1383950 [Suillus cothurnatus]|nr:hypothetical protein BD769DRAFT_1383950 [Suillus cothurnatus]